MPEPLTDEQLDALERMCAEAMPGPWRVRPNHDPQARLTYFAVWALVPGPYRESGHHGGGGYGSSPDLVDVAVVRDFNTARMEANARLIAAARDALPALIAEVRALRRVAEAAERVHRRAERPESAERAAESEGWHIKGGKHYCPACASSRRGRRAESEQR